MKITTNNQGYMNEVEAFVDECVQTYKSYLNDLFTNKTVDDLSLNEMAFIRLVSSSSILSARKGSEKTVGKTNLEILNSPVHKPSIVASKPISMADAVETIKAETKGLKGDDLLKALADLGFTNLKHK